MKSIYMVITDNGDGSNSIEWHKTWSTEKREKLENEEQYQSGDGLQLKELKMPYTMDLDIWAHLNNIYWYEDMVGA